MVGEYCQNSSMRKSTILGLLFLAFSLWLGTRTDGDFKRAYLYGYIFWMGLTLGSLGFSLLHNLTGGAWGEWLKPALLSGCSTLLLMAILFVPILFFMKDLTKIV